MKRWMTGILLLLAYVTTWATTSTSVPTDFTAFQLPNTDLSMQYLGLLFGNVANVVHSAQGSAFMGHLFLVFNKGVLIIAGLWLAYTTANMGISAAQEGALNMQGKKIGYVFLRIAVGFSLLIPSATGYSGIQDIVMKVVVEGITLADDTWSYALDYLENQGGFIYPEALSGSPNALPVASINRNLLEDGGPVEGILQRLVCMNLSNAQNQSNPPAGGGVVPHYHVVYDTKNNTVLFPGLKNSGSMTSQSLGKPRCGAATIPKQTDATSNAIAFQALQQTVMDLAPYAQTLARSVASSGSSSTKVGEQAMYSAVMDYYSMIKQVTLSEEDSSPGQGPYTGFFDIAKKRGWFSAGGFYWDITQFNDHITENTANVLNVLPWAAGYPNGDIKAAHSASPIHNQFLTANRSIASVVAGARTLMASTSAAGMSAGATQGSLTETEQDFADVLAGAGRWGWLNSEGATADNDNLYNGGAALDSWGDIVPDAISNLAGDIYSYEAAPTASNQSEFYNPISFVMHLGVDCLHAAGEIWTRGAASIFGMSIVAGICTAVAPGATILQSMISWLSPLYTASALGFFAAGFMMAFYAPLYPYLLFLFGAISWIMYVLEAMVAAPLVSFGLTHPEGHDFLGRAEQAIMLLLGVFLRPVLMIIGFLASMIMTYISFAVVNYGFSHVLREMFAGFVTPGGMTLNNLSPETGMAVYNSIMGIVTNTPNKLTTEQTSNFSDYDIVDIMLIPLMFILYGVIVIEVVNQCFSLIHVLPDQVLRWIGGPVQQDRTEQMAQKVGQQASGAAKEIGQIGGSAQVNYGTAMGATVQSGMAVGVEALKLAASSGAGAG